MTKKEFDEYLISIGGLKNGHHPDRENIIDNRICSVGEGWLQLIHDLIEELISVGWNKEIRQIKEKFAGLRFYINEGNDEIWDVIQKYEGLSYKTCETCGTTENVEMRKGGWLVTLCDSCYIKKN